MVGISDWEMSGGWVVRIMSALTGRGRGSRWMEQQSDIPDLYCMKPHYGYCVETVRYAHN